MTALGSAHKRDLRGELKAILGDAPPVQWTIAGRTAAPDLPPQMRGEMLDLVSNAGVRARAFLTGPAGAWAGLPAVLYCHAHGAKYDIGAIELLTGRPALQQPAYGEALAKAGIVTLCVDMLCFGARNGDTESALAKAYFWRGDTLFGAMLAELSGALDLLAAVPGVDAARLGVFGFSMGSTHAFWLGALEPRLRAVAHLCSCADIEALIAANAHDRHGNYMTVPGLLRLARTGEIAGLIAPRAQLMGVGLQDTMTPAAAVAIARADIAAAYAAAGATDAVTFLISPDTGHEETPDMREAVLAFLTKALAPTA